MPVSVVPSLTLEVPLDPSGLGPDTLRLQSGELRPGGTVGYSLVDRRLWFTPSVSLRAMLAYELVLGDWVRGIDGGVPRSFSPSVFVTGSADLGRPPAPRDPSFDADVAPLLETRCGSCHGGIRPSAGLALWPAERLADAATRGSTEWVGWRVLAVGSPERSYLLYKVTGSPGLVGERMPPGGALTRDQAAALERWIALGAPR
ncbi:MAG: hypothetical protein JXB32_11720 [Deltaproteobacteria bacterium]|nr:hypothetical protein [Deltaproteobacteria bacterium]